MRHRPFAAIRPPADVVDALPYLESDIPGERGRKRDSPRTLRYL